MGLDGLYPNLKRERVVVVLQIIILLLLLQREANLVQSQREENPKVRNLPDALMRDVRSTPNEEVCASLTGQYLSGSDAKLRDVRMVSRNEDCVVGMEHMRVKLLHDKFLFGVGEVLKLPYGTIGGLSREVGE